MNTNQWPILLDHFKLNARLEGLNQLTQHRTKISYNLLKLRKLERRVRCYEYLPQEHINKTNELRFEQDFTLVSTRTSIIVASLNAKIDAAITHSLRYDLASDIRKIRSLFHTFSNGVNSLSEDAIELMNQSEITQALQLLRSLETVLNRAKGQLSDIRHNASKPTYIRLRNSLDVSIKNHINIVTTLVTKEKELFNAQKIQEEKLQRINGLKKEFITSIEGLHELYLKLQSLKKSNGSVMQKFDLACLQSKDAQEHTRKVNVYLDSPDCSIESDLSYLHYTDKSFYKQFIHDYWQIFGVFQSEADAKLTFEFDLLTDKLELLNTAIRKREKNRTDLYALQLERESLLRYVKQYEFQSLHERLKRSKWHTLYREAEALLLPSWSQAESKRGLIGDKLTNKELRNHNASVLTQIRHQEHDIRHYCSIYTDINKGVKLNLNGSYRQLKRNASILDYEHLSSSSKSILEARLRVISELYTSTICDKLESYI